jgi:hypothetical protein
MGSRQEHLLGPQAEKGCRSLFLPGRTPVQEVVAPVNMREPRIASLEVAVPCIRPLTESDRPRLLSLRWAWYSRRGCRKAVRVV